MPFVDNRNLIISRGVARIFPEVRKSIYYLRLSLQKSDFLRPFGHCFWLTESPYVEVINLYVHLLRIQAEAKTTRSRFIPSNLLFSPFSPVFSLNISFKIFEPPMNHIVSPENDSWVFEKIYIFLRKVRMGVPYVWVATPLTSHPYNLSRQKAPDLRGRPWVVWLMSGESRQTIFILSDDAYSRATLWTYHFVCVW